MRFILERIPIKNPFSSMLYIYCGSILYCSIFFLNSSKYNEYLNAESALERLWSRPIVHFETSSTWWRCRKRETHSFPISLWQISCAKFWIMCLLGGRPRAHKRSMYLTKDFSCWSLRFRWFWYWVWRDLVIPRYRFERAERSHSNFLAIFAMLIWSSGDRLSIKAKAASIELILVEVEVVEDVVENLKSGHQVRAGTSWVITVLIKVRFNRTTSLLGLRDV